MDRLQGEGGQGVPGGDHQGAPPGVRSPAQVHQPLMCVSRFQTDTEILKYIIKSLI